MGKVVPGPIDGAYVTKGDMVVVGVGASVSTASEMVGSIVGASVLVTTASGAMLGEKTPITGAMVSTETGPMVAIVGTTSGVGKMTGDGALVGVTKGSDMVGRAVSPVGGMLILVVVV